jgi:hypothetical protein
MEMLPNPSRALSQRLDMLRVGLVARDPLEILREEHEELTEACVAGGEFAEEFVAVDGVDGGGHSRRVSR